MRLDQKFIIATLPIVVIGMGVLGLISYLQSRAALEASEAEVMHHLLEDAVGDVIGHRSKLLEETGLGSVQSFVDAYQQEIFAELDELGTRTGRRFFIMDRRSGEAVFCSDCAEDSELDAWSELSRSIEAETNGLFQEDNGSSSVYVALPFDRGQWNWTVFVSRDEMAVSGRVSSIQMVTLLVSLVSAILVAGMLGFVTRRLLLSPIVTLQKSAERIAAHEPVSSIAISSNDELGALARDMEKMSRSIAEYVESLDRSNKAKTDFLASMSHEIRTPLNAVMGYAQLLETGELDEQQRSRLSYLTVSARSLLSLFEDILEYAKIQSEPMSVSVETMDVRTLIHASISMVQQQADLKKLPITCEIDDSVPVHIGLDQPRVRQVLVNLLSNAVKFTEKGGVFVKARVEPGDDGTSSLEIAVIDTGVGIPEDKISDIFEPYNRLREVKALGTGLGMTIVKSIVEAFGGGIQVHSQPRVGTTVTVRFPFQSIQDGAEAATEDTKAVFAAGTKDTVVLVVEDNPINADIASAFLERAGCSVVLAENGAEGVEAVKERPFAAILMDIQMPVMDGLEATRVIRGAGMPEHAKTMPIIALTAFASRADLTACLDAGMDDYLTKPVDMHVLHKALAKWNVIEAVAVEGPVSQPAAPAVFDKHRFDALVRTLPQDRLSGLIGASVSQIEGHRDGLSKQSTDREELGRIFHKLVSICGNLGLMELSDHARRHQQTLRDGGEVSKEEMDRTLASLDRGLESLKTAVSEEAPA